MGYTEVIPGRAHRIVPGGQGANGAASPSVQRGATDHPARPHPDWPLLWDDMRATHLQSLPPMRQVTTDAGRYYDVDGTRMPSITTVLGMMGDRSALEAWKARDPEAAERIRARASYIGDKVHELCSLFLTTGDAPRHRGPEERAINSHVRRITETIGGRIAAVHASEAALYSPSHCLAGTVDAVVDWDTRVRGEPPKLAVIDFKTKSKPLHPAALARHYVQASFYGMCWKQLEGHTPNHLVIVESVEGAEAVTLHEDKMWPHRVEPLRDGGEFFVAMEAAKREAAKW